MNNPTSIMTSRLSFLVSVVLCIVRVSLSVTDDEKCTKMEGRADLQATTLRKQLLCNYDVNIAPINESFGNRVFVETTLGAYRIKYASKRFSNNMRRGAPGMREDSPSWFTITMYLVMSWKDQRLKWNKADYNNQTLVQFDSFEIWEPYISYSSWGHGALNAEDDGTVTSFIWTELFGNCRPMSYSWGDQRECTVNFNVSPDDKVQLSRSDIGEVDFHVSNSASWAVVKAERTFPPKPGTKNDEFSKINEQMPWKFGQGYFESKFVIQMNYAVTDATIFAPAAILLILLVSSTLIPAKDESRVAMLSVILVVQVIMFHQASQSMPFLEKRMVNIVELYQNLVVCSGVATIEWLIAYIIINIKEKPVVEIVSKTSVFLTLRKVFAIPEQDSRGMVIAALLDRITFLFLAISAFILVVIEARRPPSLPFSRDLIHEV